MFERLDKPFLTVDTGEAYQPIRLAYHIGDKAHLVRRLNSLKCLEKNAGDSWHWFWKEEADDIAFESVDSFQRDENNAIRLGSFSIRDDRLYLSLASFKRACLAVPFFHRAIDPVFATIHHADFLNKVYSVDERLPHGFMELFKEEELQALLTQRLAEYREVQERCEHAVSMDEALEILEKYSDQETHKKLPFVERYEFEIKEGKASDAPDPLFLSFYIFLRSRELVAIRRWFGETGYTLSDALDETIEQVFGNVGIDIIE